MQHASKQMESGIQEVEFVLVCSEIDLTRRANISLAGTPPFNHLTPGLDLDVILHKEPLAGNCEDAQLGNGSITPAIPVRAALLRLQAFGVKVKFRPVFLHMSKTPDVRSETNFPVELPIRVNGEVRKVGIPLSKYKVDTLKRAGHSLAQEHLGRQRPGKVVVFAECVPGGTTTAQLALMNRNPMWRASGSLVDSEAIQEKQRVIQALWDKTDAELRPTAFLDSFQWFTFHYMERLSWVNNSMVPHVMWAGGTQMLACATIAGPRICKKLTTSTWISTTDLVFDFVDKEMWTLARNGLFTCVARKGVDWYVSKYEQLQKYSQGFVKEGCGLGAMCVLNEMLNSHLPQCSRESMVEITDREISRLYQ